MADRKQTNIKKYKRPMNINVGMLIFSMIFIYIIICIFLYFKEEHVVGYEVKNGSLSISNVFRGIALREEQIFTSEASGYVNYYAREGSRIGFNNLVYTVDESGKLSDLLNADSISDNTIDTTDLTELKNEIVNFQGQFDSFDFQNVYDFKYNVQGTVLKLANYNTLLNIDSLNASGISELVNFCYSQTTGIVVYSVDGFETITPNDINKASFDEKKYNKVPLISNELVEPGDPVYKLSTNEIWSIVIPLTKEQAIELKEVSYVQVKFLKNQNKSWANIEVLDKEDGTYGVLSFNNSMINFVTDRYLDIELMTDQETGLKIPQSSIIEKEFYLVPVDYIMQSGKKDTYGVLVESYDEDGKLTSKYKEISIYNMENDEYYVDESALAIGDRLLKEGSTEAYTVSKRGTLIGVYNINKGYADFRQINILYENDDYAIVKPNTTYGLSVYDYIVLDATTVKEDDFIY